MFIIKQNSRKMLLREITEALKIIFHYYLKLIKLILGLNNYTYHIPRSIF